MKISKPIFFKHESFPPFPTTQNQPIPNPKTPITTQKIQPFNKTLISHFSPFLQTTQQQSTIQLQLFHKHKYNSTNQP